MSISINLELTDHCNISCGMCSQSMRKDAHGAAKSFMSWEVWTRSLENLAGFPEEVHLCPHWLGEPTLHPEFERFIEHAFTANSLNRLFRKFKLHTNGVLFSHERGKKLLDISQQSTQIPDTFNFIHFSVDAFSEQSYLLVKGADHRNRVFRNIEDFLRTREELNMDYPKITIAFVVQQGNSHEVVEFCQYWLQRFAEFNITPNIYGDWPNSETDCIYFRRLNCAEQEQSDQLHSEAITELSRHHPNISNRNKESF